MTINDIASELKAKDDFLILTHIRPDGDTVGSAVALCETLKTLGKTAWLYPNPQFCDCYPWLSDGYVAPEGYEPKYHVAVDLADTTMFPKGFEGRVDLCIDHHPSNTLYAEKTLVEADKASCGEIILEVIKALCDKPEKAAANALYVALSTDCGCFQYGNTNADAHRAAAELIEYGCDVAALNKTLFRTSSKARLALEGMIYESLRYYHEGKTVFAVVTNEMREKAGALERDCQDIASLPGRVEGAISSAVIKEVDPTNWKISLRTNGVVNATEVCSKFGGGGHKMASGCSIQKSLDEVCKVLSEAIADNMSK